MNIKLAWRNIWRNRKRSIITIVSIALAVFLAIFMRSMQLGMYANMIRNVVGSYTGYIQIHGKNYWEEKTLDNSLKYEKDLEKSILKIKGVEAVIPRLESFSLASNDTVTKGVYINGILPEKEKLLKPLSSRIISGELFKNDYQIDIGKGVSKFFNLKIGDTLVIIGQGYQGMSAAGKFHIAGIVDMKNPNLNNMSVFMSLKALQNYLSAEGIITNLVIVKKEKTDENALRKTIENNVSDAYEVMTWQEMLPELEQTILIDSIGGLLMVAILYMIITFGIFGTVLMMTQERMYEFGVMVAIGMKKRKLMLIVLIETILLTLLGVILGIIAIMPISYYFHKNPYVLPGDQAAVMEKFGFESIVPFSIDYQIPLHHGLLIFVISLIIALYPLMIIAKLKPLKAMKV